MENLFLILPLALLALLFFSNSRRRREAATVQSALAPGSQIITTAGLHATVVAVEDTVVVLEASPRIHTRWARAAVARVVTAPADATDVAGADLAATSGRAGSPLVDDAPGGAVPDDLAALDPDRDVDRDAGRPGAGGSARADGPDLTKHDRDADGGARP